MAAWCDSINLTSCFWFSEGYERKGVFVSIFAGILFFIGWWLMIDAGQIYGANFGNFVWGILGTISLVMVNLVSKQHINGSSFYSGGLIMGNTAVCWLFVGFVLGIASLFASIFFCYDYFDKGKAVPGIEILMQNVLILTSSIIYKFCRPEDDSAF